jgi:hypothetical protein
VEFDVEIIYTPLPQEKVKGWQTYMRLIWELCGANQPPSSCGHFSQIGEHDLGEENQTEADEND